MRYNYSLFIKGGKYHNTCAESGDLKIISNKIKMIKKEKSLPCYSITVVCYDDIICNDKSRLWSNEYIGKDIDNIIKDIKISEKGGFVFSWGTAFGKLV